jgi:hypothetical protein
MDLALRIIEFMVLTFAFSIGLMVLAVIILFILDRMQTDDAIRRNYPVIGRFRHIFTLLGEFFRQYFFAMDREEMPFNRAQRDWVGHAASGGSNTIAFGSTRQLTVPGTPIFVNAAFPPLDDHLARTTPMPIGPTAAIPYVAPSLFNISGMSYGAISRPAVRALSRGAAEAGIWLNTGEGGLSPHHLEGGCDIVFQIGTAKYGVRDAQGNLDDDKLREVAAHPQVRMFEVKLAQGGKPGKGGTGAAPMPLMDLVGMSIREALPRMVDLRDKHGLKDRIRIIASAKLVNPGDVAWALCAGADFVTSARGFMFSLGCIQALKCNRNTCPTGITTHDSRLQAGLVVKDKYKKVANYARTITREVEMIAHSVGVAEPRQMRRRHVRLVQSDGTSIAFNTIRPSVAAAL